MSNIHYLMEPSPEEQAMLDEIRANGENAVFNPNHNSFNLSRFTNKQEGFLLCHNIDVDVFCKALVKNMKRFTCLDMINLDANNISNESAMLIANNINDVNPLRYFSLGGGDDISNEVGLAFAKSLSTNTALKHFNILEIKTKFNVEVAKAFAEALKANNTLTNFVAPFCCDGAMEILKAACHNTSLKYISVGGASIGDEGAKLIAQVFSTNPDIWISFNGCNISKTGASLIIAVLKTATKERTHRNCFQGNQFDEKDAAQMFQGVVEDPYNIH